MLWQDYITKIPGAWSLKKGATKPKFIIDVVMRNVDFKLGFPIQRKNLNMLMNEECFSEHIFMSQYESTAHTNVNIKMYSVKPIDFKYDCCRRIIRNQKRIVKYDIPNLHSLVKRYIMLHFR